MNSSIIKQLVQNELARAEPFRNFHGITLDNIRSFMVEPFPVRTDLDDRETGPRDMWVVLQECLVPAQGYVVVYDPQNKSWGIAEHTDDNTYVLVTSAASLAEAISDM